MAIGCAGALLAEHYPNLSCADLRLLDRYIDARVVPLILKDHPTEEMLACKISNLRQQMAIYWGDDWGK